MFPTSGRSFETLRRWIATLLLLTSLATCAAADNQDQVCDRLLGIAQANPRLQLVKTSHQGSGTTFVQGTYRVFENRGLAAGREIKIGLAVLPARSDAPAPDPVFVLHGGPGAAATGLFRRLTNSWMRRRRDIVLIDQRGTGSSNALHIPQLRNDENIQSYFDSMFQVEHYAAALPELKKVADLTQYTTPIAVDDFDEIRAALGYEKINLRGGSYGTRAALVYMRRHPGSIRTATLQGIQPISYRNPLPHAASAQAALDLIFEECRSTERYRRAFPVLETKFHEVLKRLATKSAEVSVTHPVTGKEVQIALDRNAFAESVRVLLYSMNTNRRLPRLLMRAYSGDYRPIAEVGLAHSRGVRKNIAFGTLMCVVGSADISRIDAAEVEAACADTFLGPVRLRNQMSVAAIWPRGEMPENFADPVSVDVPVLFFSGTHDPATSPRWGAEAAKHMPASLHLVVPGAHGVSGPEVRRVEQAFLEAGTVHELDVSELKKIKLPGFVMPKQ